MKAKTDMTGAGKPALRIRLDETYADRLYGGFLGKLIGVIDGADIEGWSYERIRRTYGILTGYPVLYRNFCSDDDTNGPLFLMRALQDSGKGAETTPAEMGETLLNYAADGHGFFWWGGYGISTEDTAYHNLLVGIPAPQSGSIAQNGSTVAEQIGGQIFSDCWGLVCPGDPNLAAELAGRMSSATHDRNGIYGGRFIAACIADAFRTQDIHTILRDALAEIPEDSDYAKVVRDVYTHADADKDWEKTFRYIEDHYGYQHFEGTCHILPNTAVIILSLVAGDGDFTKSLNIAAMCGWDVDCNCGNVGAILGTMTRASRIPEQWMCRMTDLLCGSGTVGSLNIQTVSQEALFAMRQTAALYGTEPEGIFRELIREPEGKHLSFAFPASLCAMRVRGCCAGDGTPAPHPDAYTGKIRLSNTAETAHTGKRCLKISAPHLARSGAFELYYKTYYVPEDFEDSRYDPDFSPLVYPGDTVSVALKTAGSGQILRAVPFFKDRISGRKFYPAFTAKQVTEPTATAAGEASAAESGQTASADVVCAPAGVTSDGWTELLFRIPAAENILVEEVGWQLSCEQTDGALTLYADDLRLMTAPDYRIDICRLPIEKWNGVHRTAAGFTRLRGIANLEEDALTLSGNGLPAEVYTGDLTWKNYRFEAKLIPMQGENHYVLFRVQGDRRGYAAGFDEDGIFGIWKKYCGRMVLLAKTKLPLKKGTSVLISVTVRGNRFTATVDDREVLTAVDPDNSYPYGCVGFGNAAGARTRILSYSLSN